MVDVLHSVNGLGQGRFIKDIAVDEFDIQSFQPGGTAGFPEKTPHGVAFCEELLDQMASDKPTPACNQSTFHLFSQLTFRGW
jgi:hypothetical protein